MNAEVILALISDLYGQVSELQQLLRRLTEERDALLVAVEQRDQSDE